jgi:hypothetical protein
MSDVHPIRLRTATGWTDVTIMGPQGLPGPPGPPGPAGGDLTFVFTQNSAATSWLVVHNLGKFPAVQVVDTGNNMIVPNVHYIDVNSLQINFAAATSGKAYLN